jgi:hypothetical protein
MSIVGTSATDALQCLADELRREARRPEELERTGQERSRG